MDFSKLVNPAASGFTPASTYRQAPRAGGSACLCLEGRIHALWHTAPPHDSVIYVEHSGQTRGSVSTWWRCLVPSELAPQVAGLREGDRITLTGSVETAQLDDPLGRLIPQLCVQVTQIGAVDAVAALGEAVQ